MKTSNVLDIDYITEAQKPAAFNIDSSEFRSIKRKKEIQHIISKFWFNDKFDFLNGDININDVNEKIEYLKKTNSCNFKNLFRYQKTGFGPGEILLYFLNDDVYLGGGNSSGLDATVNISNKTYEVKSVKKNLKNNCVYDFKMGGTLNLIDIIKDLQNLYGENKSEIKSSLMNELSKKYPKKYNEIEEKFRDVAVSYFKDHETIFFNNVTGDIIHIGKLNREQIFMDRVTSNTIKPKIVF